MLGLPAGWRGRLFRVWLGRRQGRRGRVAHPTERRHGLDVELALQVRAIIVPTINFPGVGRLLDGWPKAY